MKVYVVVQKVDWDYGDVVREVNGVFASRADAEKYTKLWLLDFDNIEEFELGVGRDHGEFNSVELQRQIAVEYGLKNEYNPEGLMRKGELK